MEFQSKFLGCSCCEWPYFEGQFLMVNPAIALLGTRRRRRHVVTVSSSIVCYCASTVRVTMRLLAKLCHSEGRFCRIIPRKSNRQPRIVPLRAIVCLVPPEPTTSLGCQKHLLKVLNMESTPFMIVSAEQTTFYVSVSRKFVHFKGGRKFATAEPRIEEEEDAAAAWHGRFLFARPSRNLRGRRRSS